MKNKGVEFKIIYQKGSDGKIFEPVGRVIDPVMIISWKYRNEEYRMLVEGIGELNEYTVKVIEEALNVIEEKFAYRGERNVLDKIVSKIHRMGMVFRHKLQSSVPAPSSDRQLETEEVERD